MRNFKVGDKVECILEDTSRSILTQGKIYTIESIYSYDEKNDYINLVEIPGISFHKSRFKLEKSQIREDKLKELLK